MIKAGLVVEGGGMRGVYSSGVLDFFIEKDLFFENKMNEECGVFGVFNHENAAELTYYGLHALQHRGQGGGVRRHEGLPGLHHERRGPADH